jgi:type VI secretion system secreted protein VgrG
MAKYTQTNRPLKVFTALGADAFLLTGFRGREGVSELFSFELDLIAENATPVTFERLLGQKASVALRLGDGSERYFSGMTPIPPARGARNGPSPSLRSLWYS